MIKQASSWVLQLMLLVSERSLWYDGTRHVRGRFKIFESARHFRIEFESWRPIRIRIGASDSNSNRISKLLRSLEKCLCDFIAPKQINDNNK